MRTITFTAAAVLAMAGSPLAQDDAEKPATAVGEPATPATPPAATPENVSYAIGTMIAGNLKEQGIKVEIAELTKGLSDILDGKEPRLDKAQCQQVMMAFQKSQMKNQSAGQEAAQKERTAQGKASYEKALAAGDKNAIASRDFLAANGKRKGVTTTASGLQYEVIKAGEGAKPTAADTVKVHYHGTLPDGTVFDSSVERGEPISFPLLGVIAGWTEGVQLMPTGSKYKFSIPSYLSYGDGGSPPKIPGHSALVFEVELLAIE
jgi:FKBP-type peptidyl-prolyl cis-trans isomerase